MSLTLRFAARSDVGLIREANEDSVYAGPRLLAVADGMGGMAAGEVASNIVIATLASLDEDAAGVDLVEALRGAVHLANVRLREAVDENSALEGMGTTLTGLLFSGNRIAVVHVGDSRAYVYHDDELTQITRDDTYVQMLVDEGRITADEATTHPQRSLLTRALDGREVDPDFSIREARAGDRYLLCSDGLSGVVSPETIAETLILEQPGEVADRLIELALRGGGPDNVTCIVADVVEAPPGDDIPVVGGAAAHDRGQTSSATADTAAGRAALAAAATRQEKAAQSSDEQLDDTVEIDLDEPKRRNQKLKFGIITAITLIVVAALASLSWHYTQQQYYVGPTSSGEVAIYRGIHGSIAGVRFSSIVEHTDINLDDLPQVQRSDVENRLAADDREAAEAIVARLRERQLPMCKPKTTPSDEVSESLPTVSDSQSPTNGMESPSITLAMPAPSSSDISATTSGNDRDQTLDEQCRNSRQESR